MDVVIKACPMQNIHNICKRNVVCKSPRSSSVIEEGPLEAYSRLSRDSSPHVINSSLQFNSKTLRPSVPKVSLAQACTKGWVGRLWPTSLKLEPNHQGASKSSYVCVCPPCSNSINFCPEDPSAHRCECW